MHDAHRPFWYLNPRFDTFLAGCKFPETHKWPMVGWNKVMKAHCALYKHLATFGEIQSPSKVDLKVIYPIYPSLKSWLESL